MYDDWVTIKPEEIYEHFYKTKELRDNEIDFNDIVIAKQKEKIECEV